MKVYLAGHRGMVGSAILRLLERRAGVTVVTRTHAELDLTDQRAVRDFLASERPEVVILAAAKVGGIAANNDYPISGKAVHSIGAGALMVCLAEKIAAKEVEPLALGMVEWHKMLAPAGETAVVFRDSAFADDVAKTNLTAILQQSGLDNVRSL